MDLRKQFNALVNQLNKYKTKALQYEYGCECGTITNVEYIENYYYGDRIRITLNGGFFGEHYVELKEKEYRYNSKYHMIEFNERLNNLCY